MATIFDNLMNKIGIESGLSLQNILEGDEKAIKAIELKKENVDDAIKSYNKGTPGYAERERIRKEDNGESSEGFIKNKLDYLKNKFRLNNNTYEDILYKKNTDISESEIYNAKKYSWYESKNKELNTKLDNKISDWYDNFYGKKSSTDATGRTISPKASASTLSEPKSLRTPDGYDISKAFDMVADSTSKTANGPTALQTALNSYNFEPKLKVDADIGPKTTSRTKESLMSYGVKDVADRIEKQEQQYKQTKEYEEEEIQRNLDGEIV